MVCKTSSRQRTHHSFNNHLVNRKQLRADNTGRIYRWADWLCHMTHDSWTTKPAVGFGLSWCSADDGLELIMESLSSDSAHGHLMRGGDLEDCRHFFTGWGSWIISRNENQIWTENPFHWNDSAAEFHSWRRTCDRLLRSRAHLDISFLILPLDRYCWFHQWGSSKAALCLHITSNSFHEDKDGKQQECFNSCCFPPLSSGEQLVD